MRAMILCTLLAVMSVTLAGLAAGPQPNGGWDAAWSPDGSSVAFTAGTRHGVPDLWVVDAREKSAPRQLTVRGAHRPRWIPQTNTIVFGTVRNGEPGYLGIDGKGTVDSERPIANLPVGAEDVTWSPNGALFAYAMTEKDGKTRTLYYGRTQGGGSSGLTKNFWVREWAWTPDGSTLALVVGRATGTSLWTVNLETKNVNLLYRGYCSAPAYSPDGSRLALAIPDVKSDFTIEMIDPVARKSEHLTVQTFDGKQILWSPDCKRLYFAGGGKKEPSLWCINADGTGLTRLTPAGLQPDGFTLSPDGKTLAFSASSKQSYAPELYEIDVATKRSRKLTTSHSAAWSPIWAPDGRRLAYQSDNSHKESLVVKELSTFGGTHVLSLLGVGMAEVVWLSNQRVLLAEGGRLSNIDVAARRLNAIPVPDLTLPVQNPCWSGEEVFFTEWDGQRARIAAVKADGKGRRPLTQPPPPPKPAPAPVETPAPAPQTRIKQDDPLVARGEYRFASLVETAVADADLPTGNPHEGLGAMGPQQNVEMPRKEAPVVDATPAISPDRTLVAFARQGQIWLVKPDGAEERQLTTFAADQEEKRLITAPTWSPRGDGLLFLSLTRGAGEVKLELWLANLTAGSERLVYTEKAASEYGFYYLSCTNSPVFTPDGTRILFTSVAASTPRVVTIALDGSGLTELVKAPAAFPVLDVTGRRLAYMELTSTTEQVHILDLAKGKERMTLR